jgi:hypothetical protein
MRGPFKTTDIASDIRATDPAEAEDFRDDFRTWWKAHVKETRYWGGGPDGGFADNGNYGTSSRAR